MEATRQQVLDVLRAVVDPEMGIDIVSLGLIYDLRITRGRVLVKMTLTTRGCPMHECILDGVKRSILNLDAVTDVQVKVVWDPPWSPDRMAGDG